MLIENLLFHIYREFRSRMKKLKENCIQAFLTKNILANILYLFAYTSTVLVCRGQSTFLLFVGV